MEDLKVIVCGKLMSSIVAARLLGVGPSIEGLFDVLNVVRRPALAALVDILTCITRATVLLAEFSLNERSLDILRSKAHIDVHSLRGRVLAHGRLFGGDIVVKGW